MRCAFAVVALSAGMFAQSAPPTCPADRPVDDIIAEVQKQQSKKKTRNKNPLPEVICIWGWCSYPRTPRNAPKPAPPTEVPSNEEKSSDGSPSSSSSSSAKDPKEKCDEAMGIALSAAHNVEVGDYYFEGKNYRAALLRYSDAVAEKPGDAAIYVRLGRVLEKLNDVPKAIEHYEAAQKLGVPEQWTEEAKASLARLQ
jgi:tetratricopeptide (TPR) repeat protein